MDSYENEFKTLYHPLLDLDMNHVFRDQILNRQHIKILTYNIFLRPPPVKNNENDYKDERLLDFVKEIDNYDIICFQELFGAFNTRKQTLIKSASKKGMFFYAESESPSFFSTFIIDSGLLILSRFPIIEKKFFIFNYNMHDDSLGEKGVLYAKIQIKNSFLIVFNLHLQATYIGCEDSMWDQCVETREEHIKQVADIIEHMIEENKITVNDKILLMGDFNIDFHNFEEFRKWNKMPYKLKNEYNHMMETLNKSFITMDLVKEVFKTNPPTYGYCGQELPKHDKVLTCKEDVGSNMTLDYMMEIYINEDDYLQSANKNLRVDKESIRIEEFLVYNKDYQQLSDHFGISLNLLYEE